MKLSEAMRLGSMMLPQAFAATWEFEYRYENDRNVRVKKASCALGAVADAVGFQDMSPHTLFPKLLILFPELQVSVFHKGRVSSLADAIMIANDRLRWTREQIADWIDTLEEREKQEEEVLCEA